MQDEDRSHFLCVLSEFCDKISILSQDELLLSLIRGSDEIRFFATDAIDSPDVRHYDRHSRLEYYLEAKAESGSIAKRYKGN
jgi:hypothetical protein